MPGISVTQDENGRWFPRFGRTCLDDETFATALGAKDHGIDKAEGINRQPAGQKRRSKYEIGVAP